MHKTSTEKEFAYEWRGSAKVLTELKITSGWLKDVRTYTLTDTIYDTADKALAKLDVGVRVRSKNDKTTITAKRFLKRGANGEGIFEERSFELESHDHPAQLATADLGLQLPTFTLPKILSFRNNRTEVVFRKDDMLVRVINEDVTYSDKNGAFQEPLLEVEFENVPDTIVRSIKQELEANNQIHMINEGKTDRALRFLARNSTMHVQNIEELNPVTMPAHGGRGTIQMRFFHTAFSRFDRGSDIKAADYTKSNWEFFAHAVLPKGSEVKEHLHDRTDEFYFILKGSATFSVDDKERIVKQGDCILTRKNSRHSLTNVTEDLEFIATEIL